MAKRVRVSRAIIAQGETPLGAAALGRSPVAGVNDECHAWTGHLGGSGLVMYNPRVVGIYWDPFFRASPANVTTFEGFFNDVFHSKWMSGLAQYNVNPATYIASFTPLTEAPTKMDDSEVEGLLAHWLGDMTVTPVPAARETDLLYVIFTPTGMEVTLQESPFNWLSSLKDFSGYHNWARYGLSPAFTTENLFYAVIPMNVPSKSHASAADVVANLARFITHEMAEAFTDRNGWGYTAPNGCEIGDICELKTSVVISTGWRVQKYWSDRDQLCFPLGDFGFGRGDRAFKGHFIRSRGTSQGLLVYSSADDHWRLGTFGSIDLVVSDVGSTVGFGHAINDGRPFWVGDFNGNGASDILMYYPGDDNWWLGQVDGPGPLNKSAQLTWSLAGNTAGFGHAINDGRPFWAADFTGNGSTDILMYYPGDDNWWLGEINASKQLAWTLAGNTKGFGHAINDGRPFWIGDFTGNGSSDILMYYPGDDNWWLGEINTSKQLIWTLAGNTKGFGHAINDGRPFWIGNFAGSNSTDDILMYYPGDDNWWLGEFNAGKQLTWKLAGNTAAQFGHAINGRPFWVGDFTGHGSSILMYFFANDNWWLGQLNASKQLTWTLAGNSTRVGHAINDGRPFWIGNFAGKNSTDDILMYHPTDGNWWLGQVDTAGKLSWQMKLE